MGIHLPNYDTVTKKQKNADTLSEDKVNKQLFQEESDDAPDIPGESVPPMVFINWIDSKALFADEETYKENLEQMQSYINRYGIYVYVSLYSHLYTYIHI